MPPAPSARPPDDPELDSLFVSLGSVSRDDGQAGWPDRVDWIRAAVAWAAEEEGGGRLAVLGERLRRDADLAGRFRAVIRGVLEGGDALRLFADCGFPQRQSLSDEVLVRLVRSVVPRAPGSRDLGDLAQFVLEDRREGDWIGGVRGEDLAGLLEASGLDVLEEWPRLKGHLAESVRILTLRASALGLTEDVRRATGRTPLVRSPFHRLPAASADLLEALSAVPPEVPRAAAAREDLERAVLESRGEVGRVYEHLERTGVNTSMVYRLDLLSRVLDRVEISLPLLAPRAGERPATAAAHLVLRLVADLRHEASLGNLFRDRGRLLARKIVERSGETGARYITVDRRQWWGMVGMGAGGGLVIALAVWLKNAIYSLHPPPGTLTVLAFLDYAVAFLVIQRMHWTLATKQPPATAAALADALSRHHQFRDPGPLQDLMARIGRSQFAGLLGNVLAAGAACLLLDAGYRALAGTHILGEAAATAAVEDHAPFGSGTLFYAVLTGLAVWLSSMVAGWAENAAAYGRLQESLIAGRGAARPRGGGATRWLVDNIGGVAGYLSLALFFVLITFAGKVFGAPLDSRHVTFSAGQVALACAGLEDFTSREAVWAVVGLGFIGFLNVLTGFLLSLAVAMRARGLAARHRLALLHALAVAPFANPLRFFYPVGREGPPPVTPPRAGAGPGGS